MATELQAEQGKSEQEMARAARINATARAAAIIMLVAAGLGVAYVWLLYVP